MSNVVQLREPPRSPRAVGWASPQIIQWMKKRLADQGGDPSMVQDNGEFRFLRMPEVERMCGLRRSHIYFLMQMGSFPRQFVLGGESPGHAPIEAA
jgi:prophage regulatory protein